MSATRSRSQDVAAARSGQFFRFVLVGAVATLTTYTVLVLLVEVAKLQPVPASALGYAVGMVINYSLNYRFTFKSAALHRQAIPRFVAVILVGLLVNTLVMYGSVHWLGMHYAISQLLAIAVVVSWSYTANRLWTFETR